MDLSHKFDLLPKTPNKMPRRYEATLHRDTLREDASVDHGALAVTVHVFSQILRFIVGDLIF